MTKPILSARQMTKCYQDGQRILTILDGVDLTVYGGETLAIMGPSGSGKTSLLQCLGALDLPSAGSIEIDGFRTTTLTEAARNRLRREVLGFIFQFHHLIAELTALENVSLPLLLQGHAPQKSSQRALQLLTEVGLRDRITHRPAQLSGGERQRVAVARALITNPKCILADEPTGNLDHKTAMEVIALLCRLSQAQGSALIIVTHDQHIAAQMQTRWILEKGKLEQYQAGLV